VQRAHDRGSHHGPYALVDDADLALGHRRDPRKSGHRLLDENVTRPAHHPGRPSAGHDLHRQDAVAAEVKERVINPDPLHPEDLGVDAGQNFLDRVARSPILTRGVFRCGQGALVEFPVGCQRDCRQYHHRGGDHVGREPIGQCCADVGRVGCAGDVTHQPLVTGAVLASHNGRLVHPIQCSQGRLNFTEFNAVPADFDLLVRSAQVPQLPVRTPGRQVARAIHACPRGPERARHKPRRGQTSTPHISAAHPPAGQIHLTDHPGRHRMQPLVQHKDRRPGYRRPDRHQALTGRQRRAHRRAHRRFGRAVGVDHHPPGCRPPIHHLGRAGLTAHHQGSRLQTLR